MKNDNTSCNMVIARAKNTFEELPFYHTEDGPVGLSKTRTKKELAAQPV